MRSASNVIALAATNEPPRAFRVFTAGKVDTLKGTFLFDAKAAESVMADYRAHGVDLMVDYDHGALGSMADPALSGRAAGWFEPEVRAGELWAVNVRWTLPASTALRNKEWRYMSPAFSVDEKTGRITSLINVALTNLPATHRLEPLIAASQRGGNHPLFDALLEANALSTLTPRQRELLKETGCTALDFLAARSAFGGIRL